MKTPTHMVSWVEISFDYFPLWRTLFNKPHFNCLVNNCGRNYEEKNATTPNGQANENNRSICCYCVPISVTRPPTG